MMKTKIWEKLSKVFCLTLYRHRFVVLGFWGGKIEICEIISGNKVCEWEGHERSVATVVSTNDGNLVSGSTVGSLKKWDMETWLDNKSAPKELWSINAGIVQVCVSELTDGRLVVGGGDTFVRVFNGVTGDEIMICMGHTYCVYTVISLGVVKDRAGSFASGSVDGTIRVWTTSSIGGSNVTKFGTTGTLVRVMEVGSSIYSLSLSPCGGMVAAGYGNGFVKLYQLPDWNLVWKEEGSVKAHEDAVLSVSWSPDGRFLALGSSDNNVSILSAKTGITLRTLTGHTDWVGVVLFFQDGTKIISGSFDKAVRVWRLCEHDDRIASLLSDRTPSDLTFQGEDVFLQLFKSIRLLLIGE